MGWIDSLLAGDAQAVIVAAAVGLLGVAGLLSALWLRDELRRESQELSFRHRRGPY